MSLASILLVDDDVTTRSHIARELRELGHDVSETNDAVGALRAVAQKRPDLMVLDWMLPDVAGIELLGDLKHNDDLKHVRVLMTSAAHEAGEAIAALDLGADDFIEKPFSSREFMARIGACLRRPATLHNSGRLTAGGITIDKAGHRLIVDDTPVSLAPREYRLLQFLVANQDRAFSRQQLLIHVWDRNAAVGVRTVDVHVRRLRMVLEPFGYERYLQTVRGSGYRFSFQA
ncbi:MAG TPA: response regulator [Woeseiaceae bacterium]|nr:response regulator [Woeseiaceae bacterium]